MLLEESVTEQMEPQQVLDKPAQTFPVGMCLAVFDGVINQVPTQNFPHLIGKFAGRFGVSIASIPRRRGYGDVLGPTKVSTRYHMLPVFKNVSAEEPDS